MRLRALLFCCLAFALPARAQPLLEGFGRAQGMPSDYVLALLQTRDGYLWIGTDAGLVRYDGAHFDTFTPADGLPHPYVVSLAEDARGTLWIGTIAGLARYAEGAILPEPLPVPSISTVQVVDGIVVVIAQGLVQWRVDGGVWHTRDLPLCEGEDVVQFGVREAGTGMLAVQCGGRLWSFRRDGTGPLRDGPAPVYEYGATPRPGADPVRRRLDARDGTTYLSSRDGLWTPGHERQPLWRGHVESMAEDYEGALWFGTFGQGLFRVRARRLRHLSRGEAVRLVRGAEGEIWATGDTLLRINPQTLAATRYPSLRATRALAARPGTVAVSTTTRLYTIGRAGGRPQAQPLSVPSWISGLAFRGDTLFVSSYGQGLMRLVNGRQVDSLGLHNGLPTGTLEDVVCAPRACWLVTRSDGALRLAGRRVRAVGLPSPSVFSVYEARDGQTWFGTDRGVAALSGGHVAAFGEKELAGRRVLAFFERPADPGALWIVADGHLARLDRRQGVVRRSPQALVPPGPSVNAALYDDASDRLFVATAQGVTVVELAGVTARTLPPPRVALRRVEVEGQRVPPGDEIRLPYPRARLSVEAALLSFAGDVRGEYRLQGGAWQPLGDGRSVTFPRLAPGAYRLEMRAVNAEGTPSQAPVQVAFRVPHAWWQQPAVLAGLGVLALAVAALAARAVVARRYRQRVARYEAERRFQAARERLSRDLHDYVGGQLATLVTATELVELSARRGDGALVAQHAEAAGVAARQTLFQVRQTVHTLRSAALAPRELYEQLHAQAAAQLRFVTTPALDAHFDADPGADVDAPRIASADALQVLRIAQETVTNVLKHAGAETLWLHARATPDAFALTVEDDGCGMEGAAGNGCAIMASRAREIGGTLAWTARAGGAGTRVVLRLPIAPPNR